MFGIFYCELVYYLIPSLFVSSRRDCFASRVQDPTAAYAFQESSVNIPIITVTVVKRVIARVVLHLIAVRARSSREELAKSGEKERQKGGIIIRANASLVLLPRAIYIFVDVDSRRHDGHFVAEINCLL